MKEIDSTDKLRVFFTSIPDIDKHITICNAASSLKKAYIARQKASDAYVSHNDVNKGIRGGRHATLSAKLSNACTHYEERKEYLAKLIKLI